MLAIQYTKKMLETWRTGRLGCLYITCFTLSKKDPEELSQLERVTEILSRRPMEEVRGIYVHICEEIISCCKQEDYERAALLEEMKQHLHNYAFN